MRRGIVSAVSAIGQYDCGTGGHCEAAEAYKEEIQGAGLYSETCGQRARLRWQRSAVKRGARLTPFKL
jgi:hypothetical protein